MRHPENCETEILGEMSHSAAAVSVSIQSAGGLPRMMPLASSVLSMSDDSLTARQAVGIGGTDGGADRRTDNNGRPRTGL
jgi:type IV secretory pathway protease TraF